ILLESSLIICLSAITQGMIHVNQDVAVHSALRIDQRNPAGKILWNVSASVLFMGEFLQGDAVWLVVTRRTQSDHPCAAAAGKCLGRAQNRKSTRLNSSH